MDKRIFTFWEPRSDMPGYLQLCMRTWATFLPDYEVVICDYSNLGEYLSKDIISKILCKKMALHKQSDCVRCALLKIHGGIWLDVDTIITSANCFRWINRSEVVMIGRLDTPSRAHAGFIYALKPNTHFITAWYSALPSRIMNYRIFYWLAFMRWMFSQKWREMRKWDYCANAIIDPIRQNFSRDEFTLIDRGDIGALPECLAKRNDGNTTLRQLYSDFYLSSGNAKEQILNKTKGIILLHHSWMPTYYCNMTAEEFLLQDILLADLLRSVLK